MYVQDLQIIVPNLNKYEYRDFSAFLERKQPLFGERRFEQYFISSCVP